VLGLDFIEKGAPLKISFNPWCKGAQTKRPETKRPETKHSWTKRPWGQNIRGNKTSIASKRLSDKTSVGTKHPSDKTSGGQNVREDKTSVETKRLWTKHPSGSYLPEPCEAIFTEKNLLSVKEEKSANTHTLSVGGWGETCTVLRGSLYIYQNSLHPYHVTLAS
jgi:hypothetical protein